jgi:serine/threonine protein kinase
MSLMEGSRVGAFEIIGLLGLGGMGEVYRARDTRLKRDMALSSCGNRSTALRTLSAHDPDVIRARVHRAYACLT